MIGAAFMHMDILLITLSIYSTIVVMLVTAVFLLAHIIRDNSIMDIWYGPIYALATWTTLFLTDSANPTTITIAFLVSLWALRLGSRILRKNWGKPEDARYAKWREAWQKRGTLYRIVRTYLQVNLLQGIVIALVSLPLILVLANTSTSGPLVWLGILVFAFGLTYETVADWQLDAFLARKRAGTETATIMKTGLFRYSRRPNYFGEATVWFGFFIVGLSTPWGIIGLISPLLIAYIMTRVTGPMLENIFLEKYPEKYGDYVASTNYFFPGKPRNN